MAFGALSISWRVTATTIRARMLMYGKEASNRKQEIDRQHHTIPNQRPKDKHRGNVYNLLFRHGKVRSQNMEKLKCSFPTFCKQTFPQLHKTASYAHYAQCRLLRSSSYSLYHFIQHSQNMENSSNSLYYQKMKIFYKPAQSSAVIMGRTRRYTA